VWHANLVPPLMFLLGSEKTGLTPEQLAGGKEAVVIPMAGSASSLNLAVAAGVLLYECRRRAAQREESQ
jgi:RNA methyltransferase, TrmH family